MCGLIISCLVILQSRGLDMAAEEKKKKKNAIRFLTLGIFSLRK